MIQLQAVSKRFEERTVFEEMSLTFEFGKVYALIGTSGSGKTTLMNMMGKLEPYEGDILYRGKNLKEYRTSDFFRYELGYLFQNFGLIENQTIEENLKLGLIGTKLNKTQQRQKEKEALERVGLSYLKLDKRIFELSGGEAQRVSLAKVILKNPPFILADEPTASIDPSTAQLIMEILLSLKKENRLIVIATHNPTIWEMADVVISLDDYK